MRDRWTAEEVYRRLGLPSDYWPATEAEAEETYERVLDLLRTDDTKSGYQEVYAVGSKWQAKPYTAPGKQRNLGSFTSARAAAEQLVQFYLGDVPEPASPKPRAKRGEGRKPRQSKGSAIKKPRAARASPQSVMWEAVVLESNGAPPADLIEVPCECVASVP